ncbi:MAG: hypothetical protein AAGJ50_09010 [Pseudomonadota bacterium]
MRLPYLDKVHASEAKARIRFGLIALPTLFGTAACYAAYILLSQIFPLIGVSPDLPLDQNNRRGIAITVLVVLLLAGFIVGSFAGFFMNTVVCRYLLRWDKEKIEAVFYEQEIPDNWRTSEGDDVR